MGAICGRLASNRYTESEQAGSAEFLLLKLRGSSSLALRVLTAGQVGLEKHLIAPTIPFDPPIGLLRPPQPAHV
jgi:hypothetical protein